ncbi:MAG: efflux RND transporter periplasmic adaptor subunit, partial [Candidatus Brocadiaceae bacterium]
MKRALKRWGLRGGVAVAVLAAGAVGYVLRAPAPAEPGGEPAPVVAAEEEPQAEWWTCSMHPHIRKPESGLCPICKMPLIPLQGRQDEPESGLRRFATTAAGAALMEIQAAPVERRFVQARVRLVGKVSLDEGRVRHITAWVGGRIERLYADFTGTTVRAGDHMVELYSPELIAAQEELLQAHRTARRMEDGGGASVLGSAANTVEAAREKLRLLGLSPDQIRTLQQDGDVGDRLAIHAPIGGTVVEIHAREGEYLQTGARIYTIADLRSLWVKLEAYEADLQWLRYGQQVTFTTEAYPGETFLGRIAFISPVVDPATRTVKVRVNLPNPEGRLKPDMLVRGIAQATAASGGRVVAPGLAGKWISPMHPEIVKDAPGRCDICGMDLVPAEQLGYAAAGPAEATPPLVVPASAVLVTGTRAVVYVEDPDAERPTFEGREVVLGPRAGDHYIIEHGLSEGERVVVRGNFKIDSALQIRARPSMMAPEPGAA